MDEKISQLDNYTPPADTDVFPIVDVSNGITKKITFANLKSEITGDDTAFVRKADYDANSILYATTDNTPVALTVGTNSVVGRVAGAITTLAVDSDLTSVSTSDDTVPSAKATKTALDLKANDSAVVKLTGDQTIAGVKTFSSDPIIPDEAYGSGWNGVLEPPTKNAVYDKIESLPNSDVTYFLGAGNATTAKEYYVYQPFFANSLWTSSNSTLTDKSYYATRTVSSASNYNYFIMTNGLFGNTIMSNNKKLVIEFFFKVNSTGTNTMKVGFMSSLSAVFGAYNETSFHTALFTINNSGNLYTQTSNASAVTNTQITGITLTNWNRYRIELDPVGANIKYYVNGILKATDTTNVPTGNMYLLAVGGSGSTTNYIDTISLPTIAVEI